jgi:hypothetical protein
LSFARFGFADATSLITFDFAGFAGAGGVLEGGFVMLHM